jgi:hypothetical protein
VKLGPSVTNHLNRPSSHVSVLRAEGSRNSRKNGGKKSDLIRAYRSRIHKSMAVIQTMMASYSSKLHLNNRNHSFRAVDAPRVVGIIHP